MKTRLLKWAAVGLLLGIGTMGSVNAAIYTDTYDPDDILLGFGEGQTTSVNWTFDITDDGFDPATMDISTATVDLILRDDGGDSSEKLTFFLGPTLIKDDANANHDVIFDITNIGNLLIELSDFGTLSAILSAKNGDFYFESSTLTATSKNAAAEVTAVSEPSILWLLGSALAGLWLITGRRSRIEAN